MPGPGPFLTPSGPFTMPSGEPPRQPDAEVEAAFRFLLAERDLRVSGLARLSGLRPRETHRAVMGESTNTATLRRLCRALDVDFWAFWMIGHFQVYLFDYERKTGRKMPEAQTKAYAKVLSGIQEFRKAKASGEVIEPNAHRDEPENHTT